MKAPAGPIPVASIVVCTRERPDMLRRCLASIAAAIEATPGTEVIVVEQGDPAAGRICSELGLAATVVIDHGVGASRARNIGIGRSGGDVVLFTDDDCEVPVDWVRGHLQALIDPEVVASFGQVTGLSRWGDESHDPAGLPSRHRRGSPPWLIGHTSNMAARTTALCSIGGFDERLGPGSTPTAICDDADLIVRLLRTGSVLAAGTGEAVRHMDWRSAGEHRATVISYEHGAGVWIGKALREEPRAALSFLRARGSLLREYAGHARATGHRPVPVRVLAWAFTRGLIAGLRLKPWRGSIPDRAVSRSA